MENNTTCGGLSIRRACPAKRFGYGEFVGVYLQARLDRGGAKRFFRRLLLNHGSEPGKIITDKLRSDPVAHRELTPEAIHVTDQYANNRVEQSHEATRVREQGMRRFKSVKQAQKFVTAHSAVSNLFNLGRHRCALSITEILGSVPLVSGVRRLPDNRIQIMAV